MDIFITRQPIFNQDMKVMAYELVHRNDRDPFRPLEEDADMGALFNAMLMLGPETLTDHKKAYIRLNRSLLLNCNLNLCNPKALMILVPNVSLEDPTCLEMIERLRREGYTIVQDIAARHLAADIVKVDFAGRDHAELIRISSEMKEKEVDLLAENLETAEQFELAKRLGYAYFKGYFFAEPQVKTSKDIKSIRTSQIRILQALSSSQPDLDMISDAIESDLALSYKLLKLANSAAFFGANRITSIRQALIRVGMTEMTKWVSLFMMQDAGVDKPEELMRTSMIRAKALESLAVKVKLNKEKDKFFLVGMLSMIDLMLERPMKAIIEELPLDADIKSALLGDENVLRKGLTIISAYERAQWEFLQKLGPIGSDMSDEMLFVSYFEAIQWTQEILCI